MVSVGMVGGAVQYFYFKNEVTKIFTPLTMCVRTKKRGPLLELYFPKNIATEYYTDFIW